MTGSNHGVLGWPDVCRTQERNWRRDPRVSSSLGQKKVYGGICFLLVDTENAFNEINWVGMLWTVQYLWLSGAYLVFNWYRHWSSLVLRNRNRTTSIIHIREGVTQGDPLAMIVYGIGVLPLIKNLKRAILDVTQPWYADDAIYWISINH